MNLETTRGEDLAITISNRPAANAGLVVTMFSLHGGKVSCLSTGIRRGKARMCGSVEPLTLVATRITGDELATLRDVRVIEDFDRIKADWRRTISALHMAHAVDGLTGPGDPEPRIFGLLLNSLAQLSKRHREGDHALLQMRLLKQAGLAPALDQCAQCQRTLPEPAYYDYQCGGTTCAECPPSTPWDGHEISSQETQHLRMLNHGQIPDNCTTATAIIDRCIARLTADSA